MICYCGRDLGDVNEHTKGLCPDCGQSIWMQSARRRRPNSGALAATYNATGQALCNHSQNPCIARCGVRRVKDRWEAVPLIERQAWYSRAMSYTDEDLRRREEQKRASSITR